MGTSSPASRPADTPREPRRARDEVRTRFTPPNRFALAVVAAGVVFVVALAQAGDFASLVRPGWRMSLFIALAAAGELYTLRIPARRGDLMLSASSLFAYATALLFGPGAAVVGLCLGTLVKDGVRDR